jgi:flagellar biosynthesis chaperone FliJ
MKQLFVLIPLFFFLVSCRQETKTEQVIVPAEKAPDTLAEAYNKLKKELAIRDSVLVFFTSTMSEVQNNVLLIRKKQAGLKKGKKAAVMANLKFIDSVMTRNKELLKRLQENTGKGQGESNAYNGFISMLNDLVDDKSKQIDALLTDMESMNKDFGNLYARYKEVSEENEEKSRILSKAWFTSGTEQELLKKGVVIKEGGVLGIGSSRKLSDAFNKSNFEEIDINKFKSIKVQSKKSKIITTHPSDSYSVVQTGSETLVIITQPEKFWNASKFLVVLVLKR